MVAITFFGAGCHPSVCGHDGGVDVFIFTGGGCRPGACLKESFGEYVKFDNGLFVLPIYMGVGDDGLGELLENLSHLTAFDEGFCGDAVVSGD